MFKKLNNKLLSQYPLLWNTKLIYVLGATLITHIFFFIGGFMTSFDITQLNNIKSILEHASIVIVFSVLVSLIILIIWLVYYLRNNPFKSFYTISKNYLFLEYLLIVVVFIANSTYFFTYQQGRFQKVRSQTKTSTLVDEVNTINLSSHFIAYDLYDFTELRNCKTQRDKEIEDSIENAKNKNVQLSSYKNTQFDYETRPPRSYEYENDNPNYSYLNFCKQELVLRSEKEGILNKYQLNAIAERWLKENHTDSVLNLFNKLLDISKKYNLKYSFSPDEQVAECFSDSNFMVKKIIGKSIDGYRVDEYIDEFGGPYIQVVSLKNMISQIDIIHKGFWSKGLLLSILFAALGSGIFLLSFRLTRLKHWFIALIGIGLWIIVTVLIIVILKLEDNIFLLVLGIWAVLTFLAIRLILAKGSKLLSGILYNWAFWFTPAVIPFIVLYISVTASGKCSSVIPNYNPTLCNLNRWIGKNPEWILLINCIVILLAVYFVFIPLARKWQSNPEE